MFQGLSEERFNLLLSILVSREQWEVAELASRMQGSAVTGRELRAAAELIRLTDIESGENNSETRETLLQVARFYLSGDIEI